MKKLAAVMVAAAFALTSVSGLAADAPKKSKKPAASHSAKSKSAMHKSAKAKAKSKAKQ
jgi:hypothetical protein